MMKQKMRPQRIIAFLLSLVMVLSVLPADMVYAESGSSIFAGGSGTENDPYRIETLKQLEDFRDDVNSGEGYNDTYVILTADIDLSENYNPANKNSWTPIGDYNATPSQRFYGIFDGDGHQITGVYINTDQQYAGLFGYINQGGIRNLTVSGNVKSTHVECVAGGIAAYAIGDPLVVNCSFSGSVTGTGSEGYVGGIIGYNQNGSVKQCYNTADVTGYQSGGIAGYNKDTIENCYNTGSITGTIVGGIAGKHDVYEKDTLKYCYSTNSIAITDPSSKGTYLSCYSNVGIEKADFEDWDFESVWVMDEERPLLRNNLEETGSSKYPYTISNLAELEAFRDAVNSGTTYEGKYVKLTADIDLGGSESNQWKPIGNSSSKAFQGTFDGNGFEIKNLYINKQDTDESALFGYISGATVKNLTVSGTVSGNFFAAGIVSKAENNSVIENCRNNANITSSESKCSGIVAYLKASTVKGCCNTGDISGTNYVGGVVGYAYYDQDETIENCYNTGGITGKDFVGGVAGYSRKTIENCYNVGTIQGTSDVGGICGDPSNDEVTNCYYLKGCNAEGTSFDSDTKGEAKTADELKAQSTFDGWDFETTWIMDDERPLLRKNLEETGTSVSPYTISKLTELESFRDAVNGGTTYKGKYVKLTADIDMSTKYGEGKGENGANVSWNSIGSYAKNFQGTFDGNGFEIKNLYINKQDTDESALFGYISGATVKNLTVSGTVSGNFFAAGIVSKAEITASLKTAETTQISLQVRVSVAGLSHI